MMSQPRNDTKCIRDKVCAIPPVGLIVSYPARYGVTRHHGIWRRFCKLRKPPANLRYRVTQHIKDMM